MQAKQAFQEGMYNGPETIFDQGGDGLKEAALADRVANETSIFNNQLVYERGLRENEDVPAFGSRLQEVNKSFLTSPWVAVTDFEDRFGGPMTGKVRKYPGVMMTRVTPRDALEMAYGDRGKRIADRLMDRNAVGQEAPFPIIRSDGGHLDAPIFAFQNMANGFPDDEVLGQYYPLYRYATWNAKQATGKVPLHEVLGHGLMDGGAGGRSSQVENTAWESDFDPEDGGELWARIDKRLKRTHKRYLEDNPLDEAAERDSYLHDATITRLVGDPAELRAIASTLKHDAADVMGIDPVTRQENNRFLKALLDDYRHYGDDQPTFQQGPRAGQEAPYFNEEQRALKTYFDSLTPEDKKIFQELWFKFGQNGGADGQAGQPLVV